jgi:hypothetical protein
MKECSKYLRGLMVAIIVVLGIMLFGTTVFAETITPRQTAQWWQWVFSIPSSVHPLSEKNIDPTGADYCMVGQQRNKWYLGGVFKTVDVSPASENAQSEGNEGIEPVDIVRECNVIPLGKAILIPVLNAVCDTAGELALGNDVPENLLGKTRYLRNCVKTLADAVDENTATAYFGPVDSQGNWNKIPVQVKRVSTVLPFSVTYSPDNIFSSDCPDGSEPFLCKPDPNPSLAMSDGYWTQVRPLSPGTYKLALSLGKPLDIDNQKILI